MALRGAVPVACVLTVVLVASMPAVAQDSAPTPSPPSPPGAHDELLARAAALDADVRSFHGAGRTADAVAPAREALALRERVLGPDHADVAESANNLGVVLEALGRHAEARSMYERAVATWRRARGDDHLATATGMNNLATLLWSLGAFADARPLHERALAIRERALGADHPDVAQSLQNLAVVLQAQGDLAAARPLLERALATRGRLLGEDHVDVAFSANNLATVLEELGDGAAARSHYERALAVFERSLGRMHPHVATVLNNLARLLQSHGAHAEAMPLHSRALAISEATLGPNHPAVALSLLNIGGALEQQGALSEARSMYERAVATWRRTLGDDHPNTAAGMNNLAILLAKLGALAEARVLHERALASRERVFGAEHPIVAQSLQNLALVLRSLGLAAEARSRLERALEIREVTLDRDHPDVAVSAFNLALVLDAQGAAQEARPMLARAVTSAYGRARAQFAGLSASQRLAFVRSMRHFLDGWLRFAPRAGLSGHAEALRFRGLVARAEAAERALTRRADPETARLAQNLAAATRLSARLANELPATRDPAVRGAWQERYAKAAAERERLALALSERHAPMREALERLDLTLADVVRSIPADAALVDLLRVGDTYLAWLVRASGEPVRVELGAAAPVETACAELVAAVVDDAGDDASEEALAKAGAEVRRLVWEPLSRHVGTDVQRLVVCPDAALASIPFAALPGSATGRTLLDEFAISYVFHPFDLVPRKDAPAPGRGAAVVGAVDYDRAEGGSKERPLPARPPVLAALDRAPKGGTFSPLAATRAEAEALQTRFGKDATTVLLGADATEARLREVVAGRRFVHVATHGFARTDLLAGLYERRVEDAFLSADAERQLGVGHDPMLLSGLAMAGANPRDGGGGDDGVLTALEASYLDLDGVDLVTLSACETARGTSESGEGVLGLVSAFQMAGARRVLASLWRVDDEATRLLMEGVYERLLRAEDPLSPAAALREAALALRELKGPDGKRRYAAPRYWAAFVAYGG